jgi:type II secretory pathway pseudopilin PulG
MLKLFLYNPPKRPTGFTLTEVMVGMAVFIIGFSAVAAILPIGMRLQQQTQNQLIGRQTGQHAKAIIRSVELSERELADAYFSNLDTQTLNDGVEVRSRVDNDSADPGDIGTPVRAVPWLEIYTNSGVASGYLKWRLVDRAYPTVAGSAAGERDFYWVPLARDLTPSGSEQDWLMYAFILERRGNATYPTGADYFGNANNPSIPCIRKAFPDSTQNETGQIAGPKFDTFKFDGGLDVDDQFSAGDPLIAENGQIYNIIRVNSEPNSITVNSGTDGYGEYFWYAPQPAGGGDSPGVRIVAVPSAELFN